MICDEVVQRLPWFLNGSLPSAERAEVRTHLATCDACRAALAETRLGYRIFSAHVPAEALVEYAWDRTPEGIDSGLVERHLAECPECTAELELIRTSRRLAEEPEVALLMPRARPAAAAPPRFLRAWQASALAAALGGVVALTGWMHSENQRVTLDQQVASARQDVVEAQEGLRTLATQVDQLREQAAATPPVQTAQATPPPASVEKERPYGTGKVDMLTLGGDVTRGGGEVEVPTLSAELESAPLLLLADSAAGPDARYRIEVRRGKTSVFSDAARFDPNNGGVLYQIDPSRLGKGRYTLVLSVVEAGRTREIQSYRFEVR